MSWIRTIGWDDAGDELRALYAEYGDAERREVDHIMQVHSLAPAGMRAHVGLYLHAMRGTPGLPRAGREMIAVAVSVANGCHY